MYKKIILVPNKDLSQNLPCARFFPPQKITPPYWKTEFPFFPLNITPISHESCFAYRSGSRHTFSIVKVTNPSNIYFAKPLLWVMVDKNLLYLRKPCRWSWCPGAQCRGPQRWSSPSPPRHRSGLDQQALKQAAWTVLKQTVDTETGSGYWNRQRVRKHAAGTETGTRHWKTGHRHWNRQQELE